MEQHLERHIGDILKERNIEIVGADLATRRGFTQVPNFILTKKDISVGAKLAYAMLLGHFAWSANSSDRMQRIHHFTSRDPTRARLSDSESSIRVSMPPGQTEFTRMPCFEYSRAAFLVKPLMACFDAP